MLMRFDPVAACVICGQRSDREERFLFRCESDGRSGDLAGNRHLLSIYRKLRYSRDDLRPTRVTERNIFDAGAGIDDLLRSEGYKLQLRVTALNLTNKEALYNFLSTFSGTHFVTPRTLQVELRLVF